MERKFIRLKWACYTTNISMSIVSNLAPVLFLTFRNLYGISYSALGLLVLINFFTQMSVDLIFSFFSHKFNIQKTVKNTPRITAAGLLIFALWPFVFPDNIYLGLVIGTIVYSASGGLVEVLISPVIAAIPSDDPDREMSKLHSIYAWGVVVVIILITLFLAVFGDRNWQYMVMLCTIVPVLSSILYVKCDFPEVETASETSGALSQLKNKSFWIFILAIFLGGSAECTMAQWASGYLERALAIPKMWGDIFGVALFGLFLGLGRTLYSKYGKNIGKVIFFGAIGATACYIITAVSANPFIGLTACALTGFCVSMFWPGSLIAMAESFPKCGVFMYAMMATGGDMGAAIVPQCVGVITDKVISMPQMKAIALSMGLSIEQFAMKAGMLFGAIFPLLAIPLYLYIWKSKCNKDVK